MAALKVNVLHLDSANTWRGGQQQAGYLVQALTQQQFHTGVVCPAHSPFADFCKHHSIQCFPIHIQSEFDLGAVKKIIKIVRQHHFQILHAHDAHSLSIAVLVKVFLPHLYIIAARRVDFHVRKPIVGALKYSNPFVNQILTVSEKIRQILIEDGVPEHKISTVHSGIDIQKFDGIERSSIIRQEFAVPEEHFIVGTIAALAGHKDYPTLLKAAKIVCDQDKNITFVAVGDGPDKDAVEKLADDLHLDRFVFTGFRQDVGSFLKSFDAFVLASKTEGLGTSLLDAQAVGLPIVATTAGGIPEVVKNNENGLLVPIKDPKALAEKILLLKNDKNMQNNFSTNALKNVQKFDISQTVRKTIEIYKFSSNSG